MRLVASTMRVTDEATAPDGSAAPNRPFATTRRLLGSLEGPGEADTARPLRLVVSNTTGSP